MFIVLLNDYLKRNYPKKYEEYLFDFSYKLIILYTKSQILYKRIEKIVNDKKIMVLTNPRISELLNDYHKIFKMNNNINTDDVEFVLDGEIIYKTSKSKLLEEKEKEKETSDPDNKIPDVYNFIVYSDHSNTTPENTCVNKKIIYCKSWKDLNDDIFSYEISNNHFFLTELEYNDEHTIKVVLKAEEYNFYLVDNQLGYYFFIYLLKNYYYEKYINLINKGVKLDKLAVSVIDHNVEKTLKEYDTSYYSKQLLLENYELQNIKIQ